MNIHPIFFMLWSLFIMGLGSWTGVTMTHGMVAGGHVHVRANPALLDESKGDYMCLKIHQLGEGTKP